jgi:NADPH-dependent 2,4-dienoyl-CoA reductase/sulfur reductase-like enzyme
LRTIDDMLALRDELLPGRRVGVVGESWIGTEVTACARQRGCDVVIAEPGWQLPWDQVVLRGNPADGMFVAFYLSEGKLVGGANVNVGGVNDQVQRLLREGGAVDVKQLADPEVAPSEWRTSGRPTATA